MRRVCTPNLHVVQGSTVCKFIILWMLKPIHPILSLETQRGEGNCLRSHNKIDTTETLKVRFLNAEVFTFLNPDIYTHLNTWNRVICLSSFFTAKKSSTRGRKKNAIFHPYSSSTHSQPSLGAKAALCCFEGCPGEPPGNFTQSTEISTLPKAGKGTRAH